MMSKKGQMHITYAKGKVLNDGRYIVDRQLNSKY